MQRVQMCISEAAYNRIHSCKIAPSLATAWSEAKDYRERALLMLNRLIQQSAVHPVESTTVVHTVHTNATGSIRRPIQVNPPIGAKISQNSLTQAEL